MKLGKTMKNQFLRPSFTQNIYEHYIVKGNSLNIFGAKGVGKSRFIEDLKLLSDDETHFVVLNMRELRTDYKKFIERLEKKLGIDDGFDTVEEVLAKFERKKGKKVLVIKHFEYLFENNRNDKFNFDFFEQLNSFKNSEDVSLLIVSTNNYRHEAFYKGGELTTSPLDVAVEPITSLMQKEIEGELKRRIDKEFGFQLLAMMIIGKKYPYDLINFIVKEIKFGNYDSSDFLENNFDRWDKKFSRSNDVSKYLWIWTHIKKINPTNFMNILKEIVLWLKKKD
ncbi:MAG: Unknown protein [uncultured Sulfurovum sp.]|uniref:ORC1/DEAH AAA+ ATPase domain-containing protein n=1 Tax=uncultured Sulfurovum sp. TaxID=269237 RepID=A0A6S6T2E0_9BACT|nr:MAG: Unknown protein [uncultured Sulfurovum sp.]